MHFVPTALNRQSQGTNNKATFEADAAEGRRAGKVMTTKQPTTMQPSVALKWKDTRSSGMDKGAGAFKTRGNEQDRHFCAGTTRRLLTRESRPSEPS